VTGVALLAVGVRVAGETTGTAPGTGVDALNPAPARARDR
jgi:hypothetical protein